MKEKDFSVCLLYDIYAPLLSEKKRTAFELSYWQDLSLSEIAEHTGTTRQGAGELIRRACEELEEMEYRSKLALTENVRIVEIEGVDKCACCAPHVSNTGAIGMIRILSAEKYKGGVRLYMKAGYDALEGYRAEYEQARRISVAISAPHDAVADGVDEMLREIDALRGKISRMKREITELKLSRLEYTEGNLVLFEEEGDMLSLRNLVNEAKKLCGGICACFAGSDESGYKYIISSTSVDLRAKSKEINAAISGKGGGSSEMIQGSCAAKRAEIQKYFTLI